MDNTAASSRNIEPVDQPTTYREVETKFRVDDKFAMPDLSLTGGRAVAQPVVNLVATYFDTDDLRLARSGVTLRRRTGGGDEGWHLKLPAGTTDARDEVRLPLSASRANKVPPPLEQLVVGLTRAMPLVVRGKQRTQRTPYLVSDRDGLLCLEVVDDKVAITAGPLAGFKYREVEVEVLEESDLQPLVVEMLRDAGAHPSESKSKGVRTVAGDEALQPIVPAPERARPKDAAGLAVTGHIRTHVSALLAQDVRVRQGLPDSVHQFRVAARRLRSGLQAFGPLLDEEWARHARGELGWIAGVLSAARDREVLEVRLFAAIRALPGDLDRAAAFVAVQDHLEAELVVANDQIAATLQSDRYLTLLDSLVAAASSPPLTDLAREPARRVLPPLVNKRWKKLAREASRLHDELQGHDDHWHETRKTAKKARYSVEACIPVFGSPAKKLAKQLEVVTELLGEHQDCAVAADTIAALVTKETGPRAAFALGALYASQRRRIVETRHQFVEAWPHISHTEWRKWLKGSNAQ